MLNLSRLTPALAGLSILSACATGYTVPVTGMIGADAAQGEAVARTDGNGTFWVETIDGLRCDGTYDSRITAPTIRVPVKCSDGRTGSLLATRQGMSGTVIGKLNDGTEGRFVFGNLSFSQAFPGGEAVTR